MTMKILGIETSCDETAAAVLEDGRVIRSSVVASQVATHARYSGVVPELASREHLQNIDFVVRRALEDAGIALEDLQGIAVTQGPGLVGSLLVGLSYAKALAYACRLPLVTVNHLEGHIYSVYLDHGEIPHPILALVISGGHTNLFYSPEPGRYETVGKTRDDAAGEAFDKVAKLLKLGYPGGPVIDRLSERGNPQAVKFSLPKITDGSLDFSFSGLKTAVLRYVQQNGLIPEGPADPDRLDVRVYDLLASFQRAVVEALLDRARRAAELKHPSAITLSGGVSCNRLLRARFSEAFSGRGLPVYFPRPQLTTDNAVMIAAAGHAKLCRGSRLDLAANAYPSLKLVES